VNSLAYEGMYFTCNKIVTLYSSLNPLTKAGKTYTSGTEIKVSGSQTVTNGTTSIIYGKDSSTGYYFPICYNYGEGDNSKGTMYGTISSTSKTSSNSSSSSKTVQTVSTSSEQASTNASDDALNDYIDSTDDGSDTRRISF
jgi:hypothetical protein